ncbi:hypothetical protein ACM66B_004537 [Microbotryomycetes sp. NB124-2]
MATLRDELKAWEASFRAQHGRDPTRQEIKDTPDIAAKYKLYQQSKSSKSDARQGSSRSHKPAIAVATSSTSNSRVDKPTTPPKRTKLQTNGHDNPTSSSTRYVVATSPSKLRQLAASHSTSGSPNRLQSTVRAIETTTTSPFKKKSQPVEAVRTSPSKHNPFASNSPRKRSRPSGAGGGRNLFAIEIEAQRQKDDEAQLRRDLLDIDEAERKSRRAVGKTGKGIGWGSADVPISNGGSIFGRAKDKLASEPKGKSSAMEVDSDEEDDENDQLLGPSPVKPSTSQSTRPSLGSLFDVSTSTMRLSPPAPPKLFSTSLQGFQSSRQARNARTSTPNGLTTSLPGDQSVRGIKRSKSSLAFDEEMPKEDDEDEEDVVNSGKRTKKKGATAAKRKSAVKATTNSRARAGRDEMDVEAEDGASHATARQNADVVEIELEEQDRAGQVEKIVVRPSRALHELQKDLDRKRKGKEKAVDDEMAMKEDGGEDDEAEEEWSDRDELSLFSQIRNRASNPAQVRTEDDPDDQEQENKVVVDLPDDLAAMLSFRTSPVKKTLRRREQEKLDKVRGLLKEPGYNKKRRGLLELEDEDLNASEKTGKEGEAVVAGQVELGSDDDWESDVEGWKDLGDGEMDDY